MKLFSRSTFLTLGGAFTGVLLFCTLPASANDTMRAEGMPVTSTKAEAIVNWRTTPGVTNAATVTFTPLAETRLKNLREENSSARSKSVKIGINRDFDTEADNVKQPSLNWQDIGDGYVARLAVTSPGASALRIALQLHVLPDNAELRFAGSSDQDRIVGVVSGKEANSLRDENKVYWTPMTDGDTQNIEMYLPKGVDTQSVRLRVEAVSHIFVSAHEGFKTTNLFKAQACEVDVACKFASLGSAFENTAKAVARMVYTGSDGSHVCTGTLLNNTSEDQKPYFWSAAHCINTQTSASTLNTYWFYQAASCNSTQTNAAYRQLAGGAQLLHVNESADTLLLRLNNTPPDGAWLAGWNAERFSSGGMVGIHHPDGYYSGPGSFKKVSKGSGQGKTCDTIFAANPSSPVNNANLAAVSWTEGTTERGSSGSGLFTVDGGNYYLRGGLQGGAATCSNSGGSISSGNADCYSRLDLVYNDIKQYLNPSSSVTPGPTREYGGNWYNPNEAGWGLTIVQVTPKNYLYAAWYTYDSSGKPAWYLFEGTSWSSKDVFSATVKRYTGPSWGASFNPSQVKNSDAGSATLTFASATTATLQYNVDGVNRSVALYKLE